MGIRDLFKKKEINEADLLLAQIQMVDQWIMSKNKSYKIQFDTTVPMEAGRRKEYDKCEMFSKYLFYEEKIDNLMAEYGLDMGMYSTFTMHKRMQVYGTTVFWLISFAPSTQVRRYVMFEEAVEYFHQVFMETEKLCEELQERIKYNADKMYGPCEVIEDYQDLENCEKLMIMMGQLYEYFDFLLNLAADIYSNVPYLVDNEGTYIKIENVEKTFANIFKFISEQMTDGGCVTLEQFLELVE